MTKESPADGARGTAPITDRPLRTTSTLRALSNPNFRIFLASQTVSMLGTWVQLIAQTLLIYDLTGTGTSIGLLTFFQFAPTIVLGAWAGVVIDRTDTRRLLATSSAAMMVCALTLGFLVLSDRVTPTLVYVLAAVLGVANTFDNPTRRVLVNELVPHEHVANAVSLNSTVVMATRTVGPALAGLLIATVGVGWCFLLNGLTFVVVLVGLVLMDPKTFHIRSRDARGPGQVRAGFRYVRSHPSLRRTLCLLFWLGLVSFNLQILLALYMKIGLGGSDALFAAASALAGAGSMAAGLVLARRSTFEFSLLGPMTMLYGLSLGALAVAPSIWWAVIPIVLGGYTQIAILSAGSTIIQLESTSEMRGRVVALYALVVLGTGPPQGALTGWTTDVIGARPTVAYCAVCTVVIGAISAWVASARPEPRSSTTSLIEGVRG